MANVPIAGVSYHHDGLPKPMSVHCLGQSFNKAPIQRFATRGIANIGQNNMSPQSIRYIGIQPCMQHIHSNSPYMLSSNIPRKYLMSQQNIWHGVGEGVSPSPGNIGTNFSYGNVTGNCLPGNIHRNMSPGNISCTYRPANISSNGNNSNMYGNGISSSMQNLPADMLQQNVGFDMNGNLLVNHSRNSIVTFNNGQLKINDGQLTFNDGQIIFNGGHVRMNQQGNSEQFKTGHPAMDCQFNPNTMNSEQCRTNVRPDGQLKLNQMNNVAQFQVNTKVEGQFTHNIPHHMGQLNANHSRYKLTHLPLQKVKNQIIQDNTSSNVENSNTMKSEPLIGAMKSEPLIGAMKSESLNEQKIVSPLPLNIQHNIEEQNTSNVNHDKNTLLARRGLHDAKYEDEKHEVINYSPTYDPQRNTEYSYKQEHENFSAARRTSCSPIRPRTLSDKPWLDQADLSDTLKKVRPSWFKGELNSPKRQQVTDSDYANDTNKKIKVEPMSSHNFATSPDDQNKYNPNRFNSDYTDNRVMYDPNTNSNVNNRDIMGNDTMSKMYRKECMEITSQSPKFRDEPCDQKSTKTAESAYLDNSPDLKKRSLGNVDFPIKIKEEDGVIRDFNHSFPYKTDNVSPLSHSKTNFYDNYLTNMNEKDYSDNNMSRTPNPMKRSLDTPKISRTFFSDTQKVDSGLDFLDEPPPLIKVEMF